MFTVSLFLETTVSLIFSRSALIDSSDFERFRPYKSILASEVESACYLNSAVYLKLMVIRLSSPRPKMIFTEGTGEIFLVLTSLIQCS